MPLPELGLVRYLCIASLLGIFAWHNRETVPLALKSWPLFLVPIMTLLSIFWTPYPEKAVSTGILVLLTPIILITIAARMRAPDFLRVMMLGGTLAALYCIPYYATLPDGGPYAQKNVLAYQMMIVTLISFSVLLNEGENLLIRAVALVTAGLAFTFQMVADSATSMVLALLGMTFLIAVKFVWVNAARVAHLRLMIFGIVLTALLCIVLVIAMMPQNTLLADFLALVGKDATLTGRTDIWVAAELVAAQHPWIGVGAEGFWQPRTGIAQTLNELTHTDPGAKISFHSAFWEMRVHLGYIGLGCMLFAMGWSGLRTIGLWLKDGSMANSTLLLFFFIIFVSCFTESYAAGTFSPMVALLYFGGLAAFQVGERKFVGTARLVEKGV